MLQAGRRPLTAGANPVPAAANAIAAIAGFQMGQPMDVFGSGFGSSMGNGYVHLWTNTPREVPRACPSVRTTHLTCKRAGGWNRQPR